MTGDFPPDILKLAESAVDRGYDEGLIDAVCAALLAERERATRVQIEKDVALALDEDGHFSHWREDRNSRVARATCEAAALSIRAQKPMKI